MILVDFSILACQINSQQSNSGEDRNMDIGEFSASEIVAASGEQRLLLSQHSTGDKRSKEATETNQIDRDGSRNGTIKKRKSEVILWENRAEKMCFS